MNLERVVDDSVWGLETLADWLGRSLYISQLKAAGKSVNRIRLIRAMTAAELIVEMSDKNILEIIKGHVYYDNGTIIMPVSQGLAREKEYDIQVSLYNAINESDVRLEIIEKDRSYHSLINQWNFRMKKNVGDIENIFFQGANNFAVALGIQINQDHYLPFAYEDKTLFLDWTRGEQTGIVAESIFSKNKIKKCFIYGGCGLLEKEAQINEIFIPSSVALEGESESITFQNLLKSYANSGKQDKIYYGKMLNVHSPHTETKGQLLTALSEGFMGVEMELYGLVNAIKQNGTGIELGAIYYGSDIPLKSNEVRLNNHMKKAIIDSILVYKKTN